LLNSKLNSKLKEEVKDYKIEIATYEKKKQANFITQKGSNKSFNGKKIKKIMLKL
jgi:hypothetical protein